MYSEAGPDYQYNMQRLLKKHEFAKTLLPKPVLTPAKAPARFGVIFYGSTSPSMHEALEELARQGVFVNALRVRAFPFNAAVRDFLARHERHIVVEQNRDGQLRSLLILETGTDPKRLGSLCDYGGLPLGTNRVIEGVKALLEGVPA